MVTERNRSQPNCLNENAAAVDAKTLAGDRNPGNPGTQYILGNPGTQYVNGNHAEGPNQRIYTIVTIETYDKIMRCIPG